MGVPGDPRSTDRSDPTERSPSRSFDHHGGDKWSEAALVLDGRTYTLADLVLAAVLSAQWDTFAARVVGRDEEAQVDAEDVTQGVIAFRRARRLEAAADLRSWLSERDLDQEDLFGFVRSQLASEASQTSAGSETSATPETSAASEERAEGGAGPRTSAPQPTGDGDGPSPAAVTESTPWWPEAVMSGDVERWATTLQHWWAAQALLRERGASTPPGSTDRAALLERARSSSAMQVIGPVEDERVRHLVDLSADYHAWRELAIDEADVDRLIRNKRLDWSWYWYDLLLFGTESAVREAALCIRHDGEEIADVVARAGATIESRHTLLQDLGPDERAALVSLAPDELGGPFVVDGRLVLVRLRAVTPPDRDRAETRRAARQELADDALRRFASGKVQRVGRW